MPTSRLQRKLTRTRKIARQWLKTMRGGRPQPRPVFVLGSQRSGTRLPLVVFERAEDVITYSDGSTPFFDGVMLREDQRVAALLRRQRFPIVVLKPICESHRAVELLDRFPGARVIWIFRRYQDAVNSATAKWHSGRIAVGYLAAGDRRAAWRAGGLTEEKLALVRRLYSPDMSLHAANAVMWFLRNSLYLDLGLDGRPDVRLVRYEDLVTEPERHFARMFDFIGAPFRREYIQDVYGSSVGRSAFPEIPEAIQRLCDETHARLMACYERQLAADERNAMRSVSNA